jgi:hypothetical protein
MNQDNTSPYAGHEEMSLLLPWYANGTLSAVESDRVKQHLGVCLTCRKDLAQLETIARSVAHEALVEISPKPAFDRLMARIQADQDARPVAAAPAGERKPLRSWLQNASAFISETLLTHRMGAALATLLLAVFVPLLLRGTGSGVGNDYHTLATTGGMNRFEKTDVRVVFDAKVTEGEISQLLNAVQGRIVDGPSSLGVYTVRIQEADGASPVSQAVSRLRRDKGVMLAEPALAPAADESHPKEGG